MTDLPSRIAARLLLWRLWLEMKACRHRKTYWDHEARRTRCYSCGGAL